jgi:hypothetical protein
MSSLYPRHKDFGFVRGSDTEVMNDRSPLDQASATSFGSTTDDLRQAAAVLRGQAARRGMELVSADDSDLAAAVIGADAWMRVASANQLYDAPEYGHVAGEVYMHILLRASGCGLETPMTSDAVTTDDDVIATADGYRRWATVLVGDSAPEALRRAAGDLASAGMDTAFGAFGAVLCIAADTFYIERGEAAGLALGDGASE